MKTVFEHLLICFLTVKTKVFCKGFYKDFLHITECGNPVSFVTTFSSERLDIRKNSSTTSPNTPVVSDFITRTVFKSETKKLKTYLNTSWSVFWQSKTKGFCKGFYKDFIHITECGNPVGFGSTFFVRVTRHSKKLFDDVPEYPSSIRFHNPDRF